ncbi:MAG: tetratricopeptide repeat protein [Candidatus Methylumidiphilus sp.]
MAADNTFSRFEFARHQSGAELSPENRADFQRLVKDLRFGARFQLLIIECVDWPLREDLIRRIAEVLAEAGLTAGRIDLAAGEYTEFADVEAELLRLAADHGTVHITGGERWFTDTRLGAFNLRREAIAALPLRLLLWLDAATVRKLALQAADWWAWRGGVFGFSSLPVDGVREMPNPQLDPIDNRSLAKRSQRISELQAFLQSQPPPPEDIAWPLWGELAKLWQNLGQSDKALRIYREELMPILERLGDARSIAGTQAQIARILQSRGQWDEALRIYSEEALPVYRHLCDVRLIAMTQADIADMLKSRGQLDEALRIYSEEALPVYQHLGDVRSIAIIQGRIADILHSQGQLHEALRIYSKETLPVYQRLGDILSIAMTQGNIANILCRLGQLDEALRIHAEQVLPICQRLGDVRRKSLALYNISRIEWALDRKSKALEHVAEAYQIMEQLQDTKALAFLSESYSNLLCENGEIQRGLAVLQTALQAAEQLGQTEQAERLRQRIAALSTAPASPA